MSIVQRPCGERKSDQVVVQPLSLEKASGVLSGFKGWDYQQSPSFCSVASESRREVVEALGIYRSRALIGICVARLRRLPIVGYRLAYIGGGPICHSAQDSVDFEACIRALRAHYVFRRHCVLRIAPPANSTEQAKKQQQVLETLGFQKSSRRPYNTIVKPIEPPEDVLRASLHPKWRSCLIQSEKVDQRITLGASDQEFELFDNMLTDLMEVKSFRSARSGEFFRSVCRNRYANGEFVLHLAWHDNELLGGHLGSVTGDHSTYILGASTPRGRDFKCGYRLQWEFIKYAKSVGAKTYDLGGVDEQENPSVFKFKSRMTGDHVVWAGYFDFAPTVVLRNVLQGLRALKKA